MLKEATVALVVRWEAPPEGTVPVQIVEVLSDDREITLYEKWLAHGEGEPLELLREFRKKQADEDEAFGDYVEELLSQPFLRSDIREHGVQWLRSKIRIESYQRTEAEAAKVIADYALKVYLENPARKDFHLAGPTSQVRVRVFEHKAEQARASGAA